MIACGLVASSSAAAQLGSGTGIRRRFYPVSVMVVEDRRKMVLPGIEATEVVGHQGQTKGRSLGGRREGRVARGTCFILFIISRDDLLEDPGRGCQISGNRLALEKSYFVNNRSCSEGDLVRSALSLTLSIGTGSSRLTRASGVYLSMGSSHV